MANVFDQFDQVSPTIPLPASPSLPPDSRGPQTAKNIFDQFDDRQVPKEPVLAPKPSYNEFMGITEHKISSNPLDDPEAFLNGASQSVAGILQTVADAVGNERASQWLGDAIKGAQERQKVLSQRGSTADVSNMAGKTAPFVALPASAETAVGRIALGALGNTAMGVTKPVATGEEYNRLDTGRMAKDAIAGGLLAGAPEATMAVGKAITPVVDVAVPTVSKEIATLASRAKDFDIPLSINQLDTSRIRNNVQKISQAVPFSGVKGFQETQREAWNRAVARTIGEDSNNLGPETINSFLDRNSKQFESLLADRSVQVNPEQISSLDKISENAKDYLTSDKYDIIQNAVDKVKKDIGPYGVLTGSKLASVRSDIIQGTKEGDSNARPYLEKIVNKIDDIAKGGLTGEEAAKLAQSRYEYRNFKTLEPLLEKSNIGQINPTELLNRVKANPYIKASRTETGKDDLVDLARIGNQFLKIPGGSDTYEKASLLAQGAGGLAAYTNPIIGAKILGGIAANRAFQKFYNQNPAMIEAVISKSLGQDASKVIKLVKQGAPLEKVGETILKSGATDAEKSEVLKTIQQFTSENNNPPIISRSPNPRGIIGKKK